MPLRLRQLERRLVRIEDGLQVFLLTPLKLAAPLHVGEPHERAADHLGLRLIEQTGPTPGLHRHTECSELIEQLTVCHLAPHQHRHLLVLEPTVMEIVDQAGDVARLFLLGVGAPQRELGPVRRVATVQHLLVQPARNRRSELVGGVDDLRPAASVGGEAELLHALVALFERDDVGHRRPAPLVNRLVVVANHTHLGSASSQPLDQPLLHRVDVLVLVHDQVAQRAMDSFGHVRSRQFVRRTHHLLSEREQPVLLQGVEVPAQRVSEVALQRGRVEQLVLHHIEPTEELLDRREHLPPVVHAPQLQPLLLPHEEGGQLVRVQHIKRLVPRNRRLQQPEAVRVDGANEQVAQPINDLGPDNLLGPDRDALLELGRRTLGEGERHDRLRRQRPPSRAEPRAATQPRSSPTQQPR
jgi:hypothetical protein